METDPSYSQLPWTLQLFVVLDIGFLAFAIPFILFLRRYNSDDYLVFVNPLTFAGKIRVLLKYLRTPSKFIAVCAWVQIVIFIPASCLSGYILYSMFVTEGMRVAIKEKACRQMGLPLNFDELAEYYSAANSGKTTDTALEGAISALDVTAVSDTYSKFVSNFQRPVNVDTLPDTLYKEIRELSDSNEYVKSYVDSSRIRDDRLHPFLDFSKGVDMDLSHLANMRACSKLFALNAVLELRQGHIKNAEDSLDDILFLAAYLEDEPVLLSKIVQFEILSYYCYAAETCINQGYTRAWLERTAVQLTELLSATTEGQGLSIKRAIHGERVFGLSMFQLSSGQLRKVAESRRASSLSARAWSDVDSRWGRKRNLDRFYFLDAIGEIEARVGLSEPRRLNASPSYTFLYDDAVARECWVSAVAIPDADYVLNQEGHIRARLESVLLAIEIRQAEMQRTGGLLTGSDQFLTDLAANHLDPFTGEPLRVQSVAAYWLIYSVGPNGSDETSDRKSRVVAARSDDILFYCRINPNVGVGR